MQLFIAVVLLSQSKANSQQEITNLYQKWDRAIVQQNRSVLASIIAPNFKAKIGGAGKSLNKTQFLNGITASWGKKDAPKDIEFKTTVTSFLETNGKAIAYIVESKTAKLANGKTRKVSWKAQDSWLKSGRNWQIISTEPIGK